METPENLTGDSTEAKMQELEHRLRDLRAEHQKDHPDMAAALSSLGEVCLDRGEPHQAKQYLEESLRMHKSLLGDVNDPRVAGVLHSLGVANQQVGDLQGGMKFLQESLKMQRSLGGDRDHPGIANTLQKLVQFLQESLQMQQSLHGDHFEIAATLQKLGDVTEQSGDLKQSTQRLQESLQVQQATLHKLGDLKAQSGDLKQSMKFLQESLQIQRSLHGDRDHPGIAITLQKLGDIAVQSGDRKQGIKFLEKYLQMQRSLNRGSSNLGIAATLQKLGDLTAQSGDLKQSMQFLQESLQMQRSLHGDGDHPGIATTLHKLGDLKAQNGDLNQSMRFLQESLQMQRSLHGDHDNLGVAITLHRLGDVAIQTGDLEQGRQFLQESLQMQRSLHGNENHPGIATTLRKLGDVATQSGDITQGKQYLEESREICLALHGEKNHPSVAEVLHLLGLAHHRAGGLEEAERFFQKSLQMKQSLFADGHPSLKLTLDWLGEVRETAKIGEKFEKIRECAVCSAKSDRDPKAMREGASKVAELAREIRSMLPSPRPMSESSKMQEDRPRGSAREIFAEIAADAEHMSKPDVLSSSRLQSTLATACDRIVLASREAERALKPMEAIIALFRQINYRGICLSCQFEDSDLDAIPKDSKPFFDICNFVLTEAGLMWQVAKRILQIQGAQSYVVKNIGREKELGENQKTLNQLMRQVSEISQAIAAAAGLMISLIGNNPNYTCQEACDEIVSRSFRIEDLLLDFIERLWRPARSSTKSEQDASIENFKTIRELALECESQFDIFDESIDLAINVDIDKVTLNTISIRQLAQQVLILNQHRAPLGEQKLTDEHEMKHVFGVIVDVAEEVLLLPDPDHLAACREIIHATHKIKEMLQPPGRPPGGPPGLSAKEMTMEDYDGSTTASTSTMSYQGGSCGSSQSSEVSVNPTDSIKVGITEDGCLTAEFVSARPHDCVAKFLPWSPDGHYYYHLWIQKTICLHHVTGTCVKKDTCKWLHPNYLDMLEALQNLMRSASPSEPESTGKGW